MLGRCFPAGATADTTRKLPLKEHVDVWSSTWKWYRGSFEEFFPKNRGRKAEAMKKATHEKLDELQGVVRAAREATHNTPEVCAYACQQRKSYPLPR